MFTQCIQKFTVSEYSTVAVECVNFRGRGGSVQCTVHRIECVLSFVLLAMGRSMKLLVTLLHIYILSWKTRVRIYRIMSNVIQPKASVNTLI